jgi:hypothetical protein
MIVEMGADIALHGTHDVVLRLFRMCRRNQPVHEAADARRHAVDDTARIDEFVEQGARCGNALANLRRQLDPAVGILRGSRDRIDGQAVAVRNNGGSCQAKGTGNHGGPPVGTVSRKNSLRRFW